MGWLSGKQFQTLDFPSLLQDLCIVFKGAWCGGKSFLLHFAHDVFIFFHCFWSFDYVGSMTTQKKNRKESREAHPSLAFDPLVIHNHRRERGPFGELASFWLPKAENRWTHASGTDPKLKWLQVSQHSFFPDSPRCYISLEKCVRREDSWSQQINRTAEAPDALEPQMFVCRSRV